MRAEYISTFQFKWNGNDRVQIKWFESISSRMECSIEFSGIQVSYKLDE